MVPHIITPAWLIRATETTSYIEEVWNTLSSREQQRLLARSASRLRPRKTQSLRQPEAQSNIDPHLFNFYSNSTGLSSTNKFFNRYLDVVPYDRNRVKPLGTGERYLNASWIQTRASGRWYIATQAPLLWTANSFLSLTIGDNVTPEGEKTARVRTIVQLTQDYEGNIRKADAYFPSTIGLTWIIPSENEEESPPLEVRLVKQTVMAEINCIQSELVVRISKTESQGFPVVHLLYTGWPDHGVPKDRESLIRFVRHSEAVNGATVPTEHSPIAVGCSAGIGRTGSFIAISSLLEASTCGWKPHNAGSGFPAPPRLNPSLDAFDEDLVVCEVDWLREQRGGMVQKREQLELIYWILRYEGERDK